MVNTLSFPVRTPTPDLTFPNCSAGWQWSYNSLGQNPCEVAAYLEIICSGDVIEISPIGSNVSYYSGPQAFTIIRIDGKSNGGCECTTLVYSLFSACGACQGGTWIKWSQWSYNCSGISDIYPYAIPDGTRVPHWAYLDVMTAGTWNITAAENAGDSPEVSPSGFPQNQTSSVTASAASQSSLSTHFSTTQALSTTSAVSHSPSSSPTGSLNRNNLHAGQIFPTVVGILGAAMLITIIFRFFWLRRRRSEEQPSPLVDNMVHMAEAVDLPDPGPPVPIQYYDPSDPSTFSPPIKLPPVPVAKTTPNGENGHGTKSTGTTDRTKYSGLPLV